MRRTARRRSVQRRLVSGGAAMLVPFSLLIGTIAVSWSFQTGMAISDEAPSATSPSPTSTTSGMSDAGSNSAKTQGNSLDSMQFNPNGLPGNDIAATTVSGMLWVQLIIGTPVILLTFIISLVHAYRTKIPVVRTPRWAKVAYAFGLTAGLWVLPFLLLF